MIPRPSVRAWLVAVFNGMFGKRVPVPDHSSPVIDIAEVWALVPDDETALLDLLKQELLQVRTVSKHFKKINVHFSRLERAPVAFNVLMYVGRRETQLCVLTRTETSLAVVVDGAEHVEFTRVNVKDVAKLVLNTSASKKWLAGVLHEASKGRS